MVSGTGTADELLAFQRLAWSTMVFSVTRRCPLRCSHCVTSSGPDIEGGTVSAARAEKWAVDFPALAERGLKRVSFTGGEPVLALPAVRVLANGAKSCGIRPGIVTSGAWSSTAAAAAHVVDELEAIAHWDFGYDEYHQEGLSWERFCLAIRAVRARGRCFSVRVCQGHSQAETQELLERVRVEAGDDAPVFVQPVRRLGRAGESIGVPGSTQRQRQPCVSTGPFVREDGSAGPCCSGLAYPSHAGSAHPFQYGNADEDGLLVIWERWKEDQLLRLMRLVGLEFPLRWIGEHKAWQREPRLTEDVCESCADLWAAAPEAGPRLRERTNSPEVRQQLDAVERHLYGALWEERVEVRR